MSFAQAMPKECSSDTGKKMYRWATDLFPVCRSLTGQGVRETLFYFQKILPDLIIHEVPTGYKAFDWVVPDEWNIREAFVSDGKEKIIDFEVNNLHVMGYSEPIDRIMSFEELDQHLYSLPDQPGAIPYITSYYKKRWGFCLSHNQRLRLNKNAQYHVKIDATLEPGMLNYGELVIPGETKEEILLSTYVCHPSMANNELSGPCVAVALAEWIKSQPRRYTYRILLLVETIGSIVYLSKHLKKMKKNTIAGFVLTCMGDNNAYSYVASRNGDTVADKVAQHVLRHHAPDYISYTFLDRGSDERQYCSPGVDLPVCSVIRSKYGIYPEYHTSLDNLDYISPAGLQGGYEALRKCIEILEANRKYKTTVFCEPQLGKRGLYPTISTKATAAIVKNMMATIAYADGQHDLIDIAEKLGVYAGDLVDAARRLEDQGLFTY